MGCGGSLLKTAPLWPEFAGFQFNSDGDGSSLSRTNNDPAFTEVKWKLLKAQALCNEKRKSGENETDPLLEAELLALLEDSIGHQYFSQYLRAESFIELSDCWQAIDSFKKFGSGPLATSIFQSYVLEGNNYISHHIVTPAERNSCCAEVKTTLAISGVAKLDLFDWLQQKCFAAMYWPYVEFKTTGKYVEMTYVVRHTYNTVGEKDFEYVSKLGEGGKCCVAVFVVDI